MMIKGSLFLSAPIVKHFQAKKTSVFSQNLTVFGDKINKGIILHLSCIIPKMHIRA